MIRSRSFLSISVAIIFVGAVLFSILPAERRFEGKTAKWWFDRSCPQAASLLSRQTIGTQWTLSTQAFLDQLKVVEALRSLQPESTRYLTQVLIRRDTASNRIWKKIWNQLPPSIQNFVPRPVDIPATHLLAAAVLSRFGTNAQVAVPELVRFFDTPEGESGLEPWIIRVLCNSQVSNRTLDPLIQRFCKQTNYDRVLNIVEETHRSSSQISESLVLILERGNSEQQRRAAWPLTGSDSFPAITFVPLRKALTNTNSEVRYAAIKALTRSGMDLVPIKPDLEKAALDENGMVATVARRTLENIGPK
jgi:hypothetical protein